MTTVVIKDGVIYTDTKGTAVIAKAKTAEQKAAEREIVRSIPGLARLGRIGRQSSFFIKETETFDLSKGKFVVTKNLELYGDKVHAVAVAGNAGALPIVEYADKQNYSLTQLMDELRNLRNLSVKAMVKSGMDETLAATYTFSYVAMVTDVATYVAYPAELYNGNSEWKFTSIAPEVTVAFGSGRDRLSYITDERIARRYRRFVETGSIRHLVTCDLCNYTPEEFIKAAAKEDPFTGDEVVSYDTTHAGVAMDMVSII